MGIDVVTVLVDLNIEGQALVLWGAMGAGGWADLVPIRMVTLADVGLPLDSSDRDVWRFAQANSMILLSDNRNMQGRDSLEQTIREENTLTSLPVLTIGSAARLDAKAYRERVMVRLIEIVLALDDYRGAGRIYLP